MVAQLNLFDQNPRTIQAIPFAGHIFVVNTGGMSCYDPLFNEWKKRAAPPRFGTKFNAFIEGGDLKVDLYEPPGDFEEYIYHAPTNQWCVAADDVCIDFNKIQNLFSANTQPNSNDSIQEVYINADDSLEHCFNLELGSQLYFLMATFNAGDAIHCLETIPSESPFDFVSKRCFTAAEKACFGDNFKFIDPSRN